jgi:O-antigen/teichoic acid export membrane protein
VQLLAGDASDPSIGLLRLQSFALVGTFIAVAGGFALLSLHSHRALLLANVAALATSIVLSLALIPGSGSTGAAVAVLAAELALAATILLALLRERPAVAVAVRRAPPILLACAVAGLAALVPAVPDLVRALLGAAAFPALLVAVHRFPPEVADALRGQPREETA